MVKELDSFQITTILWAYAKLNVHPGIEVTEALIAALTVKLPSSQPQVQHVALHPFVLRDRL